MLDQLQPCKSSNSCTSADPTDEAALLHFPPTASMRPTVHAEICYPCRIDTHHSAISWFRWKSDYSDLDGCIGTIQAKGGVGTFYADAVNVAQSDLTTNARPGAQNVLILLSDGEANASSSNVPGGEASNQCRQAVHGSADGDP